MISVITFFTLGLIVVPIAIIAWFVNIARFRSTVVRIDTERVWVGRRSLRLTALDLSKIGRATNPWPWRAFNHRYLGGNPIWTGDSVGIRGREGKKRCWLSVGTNRRDEFLQTLVDAAASARTRSDAAAAAYAGDAAAAAGLVRRPVGRDPDPVVGRARVDGLRRGSSGRERAESVSSRWCVVIPIADETPVRRFPVVTMSLIALCVVVFFVVQPTHLTTDNLVKPDLGGTSREELRFTVK